MKALADLLQRLVERLRSSQTVGPSLIAVVIGVSGGVASYLFAHLIIWMNWLFFIELGGLLKTIGLGPAYTIPILALGGLLVGIISYFFAPETKGHGVPEVMLAVAQQGGRIHARVPLFKALASAFCIGSGGSAGAEGPIIQIGSAFGSTVGQLIRLPDRRVILSVACGAAGGVAATFNTPIAGVMFALEVILGRFTSMSFGLVVLSATTATIVSRALLGNAPRFHVLHSYALTSNWEFLFYAVLGICSALAALAFVRTLYAIEDACDAVRKVPEYVKPALGGAVVGLVGIFAPQVFGGGYETINAALNSSLTIQMLIMLSVMKIIATSLTVGSGGSGGIFAPSLFIGAMVGGAFGSAAHHLFPSIVTPSGAYALVGMAAVFSGAAHAPITSIMIVFEMTDDYRIILPLMTATVISTFVSQRISPESIYTLKLRRRGINIGLSQDVNIMDAITVRDAMTTDYESVSPDEPVTSLIMKLATAHETGYPVLEDDGALVGIVTVQDVENALLENTPHKLKVRDVCTKNVVVCRPDQTLTNALSQFSANNIGRMPVIDPYRPGKILGMLRRSGVLGAYSDLNMKNAELMQRVDELRSVSERSDIVMDEGTLTSSAELSGKLVREAQFPKGSTLVAIRRGDNTIIPNGSTSLEPADILVVLSTRQDAKAVRKWLKEHC